MKTHAYATLLSRWRQRIGFIRSTKDTWLGSVAIDHALQLESTFVCEDDAEEWW